MPQAAYCIHYGVDGMTKKTVLLDFVLLYSTTVFDFLWFTLPSGAKSSPQNGRSCCPVVAVRCSNMGTLYPPPALSENVSPGPKTPWKVEQLKAALAELDADRDRLQVTVNVNLKLKLNMYFSR